MKEKINYIKNDILKLKKIIYKKIKNMKILEKLKYNNKNNKNDKLLFLKGIFSSKDLISPSYINLKNPKYFEIDNTYYSTLIISNYSREQKNLILRSLIDANINLNISMFYEKQDTYKTIRDLTYHIGNVGVDVKDNNQGRQDYEIAAFTYNDAKYIRKEMQVNNEELYFLYIYINIFSSDLKELEYNLNKIEGIIQSSGMQSKRAYFRQEQGFLTTLPIMHNSIELKEAARRNVLTSGIMGTYPFISSTIFDDEGVFIGTNLYNNSLVFVDRFNSDKYKNANMCILGASGAGKSFYTKLLILRNSFYGIEQFVIDPEREYENLCRNLEGTIIKLGPCSNNYINIFDIREESLEEDESGYLANKIAKLIGFFKLIFGDINEEEKALIEEKIILTYEKKKINFDDSSLLKESTNKIIIKPIFKDTYDMPKLEDFYNILGKDKRTKKFQIKLIPFIKGSLNYFNNYTNVELSNKLIIADIYELGDEELKYGLFLFTELFWDKIKKNRKNKKSIYIDEIWRLIGVTSNKEVASFVYKIFKTIRKYGGSAVAITQDVSDLFSLENGNFGRSILNNSEIKNFFSLEEENIRVLEKNINLTEKEKVEIKSLKKGECLMFIGREHILTKIESDNYEREIINK